MADDAAGEHDARFGLVALRRGVDPQALRAAIDAMTPGGSTSLGRTLVERGAIGERDYEEIERELRGPADLDATLSVTSASSPTMRQRRAPAPARLTLDTLREVVAGLRGGVEADLDSTLAAETAHADPEPITFQAADLESTGRGDAPASLGDRRARPPPTRARRPRPRRGAGDGTVADPAATLGQDDRPHPRQHAGGHRVAAVRSGPRGGAPRGGLEGAGRGRGSGSSGSTCAGGPRRGLHRARRGARPRGRAQGDPGPARRRPAQPQPLPDRGRGDRRPGAPGDRAGLRARPVPRRPPLLRDAVHPRPDPQGRDRRVPPGRRRPRPRPGPPRDRAEAARRPLPRRLPGDGVRPRPRGDPPRPEAGQRDARRLRRDARGRLGPGQDAGGALDRPGLLVGPDAAEAALGERPERDPVRLDDRHAAVHEPRAGRRPARRDGAAERRLQPGRHLVRRPDRRGAVPRPDARHPARQGQEGGLPAPPAGEPARAQGARSGLPEGDGARPPPTATQRPASSPTTSSGAGWPTSRCRSTGSPGRSARRAGGRSGTRPRSSPPPCSLAATTVASPSASRPRPPRAGADRGRLPPGHERRRRPVESGR